MMGNMRFIDHRKLHDQISELQQEIKQRDKLIKKLELEKEKKDYAKFLLNLVNKGSLNITQRQVAEFCQLAQSTVYRLNKELF